jgi:tetratricopeptide (TPR) repeat protein
MNGMKQATIKLHELTRSSKDSIIVATNCFEPLQQYVKSMHLPWIVDYVRYGQRYDKAWDYCILFSRFVDKNLLQGGYFPPKSMVASVNADETVLYAILKNDPERNAYKAAQCLAQKDFINALTYFDKSLTFDSNNETAYINAAIAAANVGDMNKAIAYIEQVLKMNPEDLDALQIAMQLYQAKGDTQTAQKYYSQAQLIIEKSQQE